MAGVYAQAALTEHDSPASRSESATASTSDGIFISQQARAGHLTDAVREPVSSWLDASPSAFMHGSDSTCGEQRRWSEGNCRTAAYVTHAAQAARPTDPLSSSQGLVESSLETHPVTLCFHDGTVERLFDNHRAACASRDPTPWLSCTTASISASFAQVEEADGLQSQARLHRIPRRR